jgi:hypothetical protein
MIRKIVLLAVISFVGGPSLIWCEQKSSAKVVKKTRRALREQCCGLLGDLLYETATVLTTLDSGQADEKAPLLCPCVRLIGSIQQQIMDLLTPCLSADSDALLTGATRKALQEYSTIFDKCLNGIFQIENMAKQNDLNSVHAMLVAVQRDLLLEDATI